MCDGYYEIYQKQEDTLLCYEVNGEVCERACVTLCQNCADVVLRNARGMGAKLCLHGLIEENSIQKVSKRNQTCFMQSWKTLVYFLK